MSRGLRRLVNTRKIAGVGAALIAVAIVLSVSWQHGHTNTVIPGTSDTPTLQSQGTAHGKGAPGAGTAKTLVLYDSTGPYGWLGELYGIYIANLASHFGTWTAEPVTKYRRGQIQEATTTVYIGSTYDEPLPVDFLSDVYKGNRPIIWMNNNIWQLSDQFPDFSARYGWQATQFDTHRALKVTYRGVTLDRSSLNKEGLMQYSAFDSSDVKTIATAHRDDGTTLPWAVRSKNLTYIGEIPFAYSSETDRSIIISDLLYDALAPNSKVRHRALLRLEDINPSSSPSNLRSVADLLWAKHVPFGFGVIAQYKDPKGAVDPTSRTRSMHDAPQVVKAIRYLQSHGGTMIEHGYTHQYLNLKNPYNGVTADDVEFFRVIEQADHTLKYKGQVKGDSVQRTLRRINSANKEFDAAGLSTPSIFEFPHYIASVPAYRAVERQFKARWERGVYYGNFLSGGPIAYNHSIGQSFPYVVRDVYGSTVLPENLGAYSPRAFHQFPPHKIADILRAGSAQLVVRDGIAGVYYHPYLGHKALGLIVDGLRAQGWQFVSPASVARNG